jgi:hypothetical protein
LGAANLGSDALARCRELSFSQGSLLCLPLRHRGQSVTHEQGHSSTTVAIEFVDGRDGVETLELEQVVAEVLEGVLGAHEPPALELGDQAVGDLAYRAAVEVG